MQYRALGETGIEVSAIGLGTAYTFGDGISDASAVRCVRAALDQGITLFDTADSYSAGEAERVLGRALDDVPRSDYLLCSKVYFPVHDGSGGLSAERITRHCEESLRRLGTDHLDIYLCHRYDPQTPLEETLTALGRLVNQGKVRCIGFSEWGTPEIRQALQLHPGTRFAVSQPQYSVLWRAPEREVFPLCAEHGISQVVWSPLAEGVLTGKYPVGHPPPADSRVSSASMGRTIGHWMTNDVLGAVDRLRPVAREAGLSLPQLALAWVLGGPTVAAALIGATGPAQIAENAMACEVTLTLEIREAIDTAVGDVIRWSVEDEERFLATSPLARP